MSFRHGLLCQIRHNSNQNQQAWVRTPYTFDILFVWCSTDKKLSTKISFRHGICEEAN